MKKTVILFYFLTLLGYGQEIRMWIPSEAKTAYNMMVENGAQFHFEDLYHPGKPSFNDAIVSFNGGCTGEVISPQGLVLTNHHCGYAAIQAHSTLEHNYVENGFWAKSFEEELPNPGMYVTFIKKIINVTGKVLQGVKDEMTEKERQSLIDKNINRIKKELSKEAWQEVEIKPFFYGNKYYAFIKETFRDIRLVAAPPASIGKFGADTDNWMWPRHSGDFSIFRIYAGKDNKPAPYSEENVPYRPEKYLKVSMKGINEGDLIVVYGFPGRTREYLPSFRVKQIVEDINPVRIKIRDISLKIMDKFMRANDTIDLKYTSHYARISNYWKKWQGENLGIKRTGAIAAKQQLENDFLQTLKMRGATAEDLQILNKLKDAFQQMKEPELARDILIETAYINSQWLAHGFYLYRLENALQQGDQEKIKHTIKWLKNQINFEKEDPRVEEQLFVAMMEYYKNHMPSAYSNEKIKETDIPQLAREMAKNSVLANAQAFEEFLKSTPGEMRNRLNSDSGYILARALITDYYTKINPDFLQASNKANQLMRSYIKLLFHAYPNRQFIPDANSTLRISFGKVAGYDPRDGVHYDPVSTLDGVIEKYIPGDYEFDVPRKLLEIYEKKDFGPYEMNGTVPVDFLGTAHTTGGNSGSPALNKKGELVGLNFDRVWEGTMSDLYYDPSICRNIMVDMRYVLFIIDKLGENQRIIQEINPIR